VLDGLCITATTLFISCRRPFSESGCGGGGSLKRAVVIETVLRGSGGPQSQLLADSRASGTESDSAQGSGRTAGERRIAATEENQLEHVLCAMSRAITQLVADHLAHVEFKHDGANGVKNTLSDAIAPNSGFNW